MDYQQKPLVIPKLEITSEERKPFTMWFLNTKARKEVRFNFTSFYLKDLWKGVWQCLKSLKSSNQINKEDKFEFLYVLSKRV